MNRLKEQYLKEIVPKLMKEFGYKTKFAVPSLKKIVINMGVTRPEDIRARKKALENISEQFKLISGQKPQITKAKKSIANFKLREGDPLGLMVTLRGERMWQFFDKLISIVLPQVKDFRGCKREAFDSKANYSLGLSEQIIFPEINYSKIESVRSLQINLATNHGKSNEVYKMLELFGFPFAKLEKKRK
jgi:large subunit ribosomal protein L5